MTERFSDPVFEDVIPGLDFPNECSPELDGLGISLNAPEVVRFSPGESDPMTGAFALVIVCGSFKFEYSLLGLNGDFLESIVLVAVDEETRTSYRGTMPGVENPISGPPDEPVDQESGDFRITKVGGYFNPNLAAILDLPAKPADYVVYALLGPYESNRVRISVREFDE